MNQANLQLEGLLMAVAALNRMLVEKGLAAAHEIEAALHRAEAQITSDDRFQGEDIALANRDAMCFPIRLLRLANGDEDCAAVGFSELARQVGLSKPRYNDQR
jgi:hypothetical protein